MHIQIVGLHAPNATLPQRRVSVRTARHGDHVHAAGACPSRDLLPDVTEAHVKDNNIKAE